MEYILALETTGADASVALIDSMGNCFSEAINDRLNHLQNLMPMVSDLMEKRGAKRSEIAAVAVSEGPGSFTGIRIGMAAAKGLAFALGIKIITVPTLKSFAYHEEAAGRDVICLPIFDARRNQVYAGAYVNGNTVIEDGAYDLDEIFMMASHEAEKRGGLRIVLYGDGTDAYRKAVDEFAASNGNVTIAREDDRYQDAKYTAILAHEAYISGDVKEISEAEPVYIRKAEAQRKLEEALEKERLRAEKGESEEEAVEEKSVFSGIKSDDIVIRVAEACDVDQIAELDKLCFAVPWSRDSFETDITKNEKALYYAASLKDGTVCGYAGIWCVLDEGQVTNVAVHPECRMLGIGTRLVDMMIKGAEERGAVTQTLEVRESNRDAIMLYKRAGFKVTGMRKKYYSDNNENALLMTREADKTE